MEISSIPAASMSLSQAQVQHTASMKVMKQVMNMAEESASALLEGMEAAITGLGANVDTSV